MSKHPDAGELADEFGMTIHYGREDKVAEHVHEWYWNDELGVFTCVDIDCQKDLRPAWAVPRLNATEKLSAEDAIEVAISARAAGSITDQQLADKADAYAAALEKDE